MADKIVVKNLYKIFGDSPQQAMALLAEGVRKEEIFKQTSQVVGVCDASFEVREGEIFVVMGLSGSGKSTLVRLLNRLIEPTAGQIIYDGVDIAGLSDHDLRALRRSDLSMVFQSFALMPHLSVLENTAFGLELAKVPRGQRLQRAEAALAQVGLEAYGASYPAELSGGMQQRVGLARALANDPAVMLMDEAFSALDPLIRTEMQDELLALQQRSKRTIIFISHDLDEAMRIGDRIAIMEGGRIIQVGTPQEIIQQPADDYVRSFFRGVNVSTLLSASDVAHEHAVFDQVQQGDPRAMLSELLALAGSHAPVVGPDKQYLGVVSEGSLRQVLDSGSDMLPDAFMANIEALPADMPVSKLIARVAQAPCPLPVISAQGRYLGAVTKSTLLKTLDPDHA